MWLTNGKETLELTHPVQIAAFKVPEEPAKEEPAQDEAEV